MCVWWVTNFKNCPFGLFVRSFILLFVQMFVHSFLCLIVCSFIHLFVLHNWNILFTINCWGSKEILSEPLWTIFSGYQHKWRFWNNEQCNARSVKLRLGSAGKNRNCHVISRRQDLITLYLGTPSCPLDTVRDFFLNKLCMKPCINLVEISIFFHEIVKLTKIMNNLLKHFKNFQC